MHLVILHYHLNSGGVARVVHNHLLALAAVEPADRPERVLLVQGRANTTWPHDVVCRELPFEVELITVEGLDYDQEDSPADEIATAIKSAGCRIENTTLHWHNHSLGKNVSAPLAVHDLAQRGYRTLLQIHDFAEDFRPDNYRSLESASGELLATMLYPQSEHIHYATLNRRDTLVLDEAGVPPERLHVLPNPVADFGELPATAASRERLGEMLNIPGDARLLSYPVRGIRRKNLGEVLLWSTLVADAWFFVTLAPENPVELSAFDRWRRFADELGLRCRLGKPASADISFAEILAGSDALVTTSVAEGFGMAFLECWLAGRALFGRNLPEITSDACEAGLDLDGLYDELAVPCDWIDPSLFIDQMCELVNATYIAFGKSKPRSDLLEADFKQILELDTIDFARLPTQLQCNVIRRAHGDADARAKLLELNPQLHVPTERADPLIQANAAIVSDQYSLPTLGKRLAAVYTRVMVSKNDSPIVGPQHGEAVLDAFLKIDRLHAIRVEP
jgi:glycosyltransferase involved in cell wall biosynthesis